MAGYATPITEPAAAGSTPGGSGFLTREEVMTAREVAALLRMPTSTVYELARKGVLPPATRSEPSVCLRSWNLKGSRPAATRACS